MIAAFWHLYRYVFQLVFAICRLHLHECTLTFLISKVEHLFRCVWVWSNCNETFSLINYDTRAGIRFKVGLFFAHRQNGSAKRSTRFTRLHFYWIRNMKLMRYVSIYGDTQKLLAAIFDFVICLPTGGGRLTRSAKFVLNKYQKQRMCWCWRLGLAQNRQRKNMTQLNFSARIEQSYSILLLNSFIKSHSE